MQKRLALKFLVLLSVVACATAVQAIMVPVTGLSTSDTDVNTEDDSLRTIESVSFSPDGQKLLFVGNLTSGVAADYVYTTPLTGGAPTKISVGTADVDYTAFYTPDGTQVVYAAATESGDDYIYRVPAGGGAATTVVSEDTQYLRLTPNGQTVVFLSRPTGSTPDVLRSVPLTGGTSTVLSTPTQGDIDRSSWGITPDGQTVVFGSTFLNSGSGNEDSLFSVPVDGSASPSLINFGPTAPHIIDIEDVAGTIDGKVAFITDYTVNNNYNLHFVPLGGGTTSLLPDFDFPGGSDFGNFAISPNGQYVAFSADLDTIGVYDLYVVSIFGGEPIKVSDPITAEAIDLDISGDGVPDISDGLIDGDVIEEAGTIAWSPDGSKIAYIADSDYDELFQLHLVDNPLFVSNPLSGDANGDGKVDILDLDILSGNFGTAGGATLSQGDFNGDGNVDILDLDILSGNFGAMASQSTTIPEPGSALLMLLAAGTYPLWGRRRKQVFAADLVE